MSEDEDISEENDDPESDEDEMVKGADLPPKRKSVAIIKNPERP